MSLGVRDSGESKDCVTGCYDPVKPRSGPSPGSSILSNGKLCRKQPVITTFTGHGLAVPCERPCNTPIFPVASPPERLVPDLRLVGDAVVPLHPMVATLTPCYHRYMMMLRCIRG